MGRGGGQNFSRDVDQEGSRTVLNPKKAYNKLGLSSAKLSAASAVA